MKISVLPRFVVLKSKVNNKYLQLAGEPQGRLQFTAEEVTSPLAKFEVVMAKSERLRFVHLKCCSNHKYCVASDGITVSAEADEPEEDQSKLSCTLFEPVAANIDDLNTFRFKSVSQGKYAVVVMEEQERLGLGAADGGDLSDAFTAIDWWQVGEPPKTDVESRARALSWFKKEGQPPTIDDEIEMSSEELELELDPLVRAAGTSRTVNVSEYHLFAGFFTSDEFVISTFEATNANANVTESATFVSPNAPQYHLNNWHQGDTRLQGYDNGASIATTFNYTGRPDINSEGKLYLLPIQETKDGFRWSRWYGSYLEKDLSYTVMVPPRTRARVKFLATDTLIEVPFSYTRQDTLSTGTAQPRYNMYDGIYNDWKTSDPYFDVTLEKL